MPEYDPSNSEDVRRFLEAAVAADIGIADEVTLGHGVVGRRFSFVFPEVEA